MDARFAAHNSHLEDPETFWDRDPHLRRLSRSRLVHRSRVLDELPSSTPGIYTVGGGRQVGKTTLLKQWMYDLLGRGVEPARITYFTGELIDDHHSLVRLVTDTVEEMPARGLRYLLLDEVTYIRQWDRGIKFLADAGLLEDVALVLTGSDLALIQEARMRFPGRRGMAPRVDFHLYPLSFREAVLLKDVLKEEDAARLMGLDKEPEPESMETLFAEFEQYLVHGGYLTAMNDMAEHGRISDSTLATYSDWIRGDVLKRGKNETYLREILSAIISRYCTQVTWNNLAKDLSIDHPKTVADYLALLQSMDAVLILAALQEHKLAPAPKKGKKVMFTDPFIYHAIHAWLHGGRDNYERLIIPCVRDPGQAGQLVESCVAAHFSRLFPSYYIKAQGEVDLAYVKGDTFWPVEVKWSGQVRSKDLKQVAKYPNGRILDRSARPRKISGLPTEPVPLALFRLPLPQEVSGDGHPGSTHSSH
ncbi:MAG: ATP-binding protein [Deltaproteobacteria bacterium]|nr:ATP-binding protein [Deltaproteobacteria bacterium]